MKKRIFSLLLALTLLLAALPVAAVAADTAVQQYGTVPIYVGYADLDYMAEQILKGIDTSGKTDRERIRAVYDWIILNCARYGEADKAYFDIDQVLSVVNNDAYLAQLNEAVLAGELNLRIDVADSLDIYLGGYDTNYYVSSCAYYMMMYRVGQCNHFSALLTLLLGHLGYDCRLIAGEFLNSDGTVVEHKWNMVLLDGKYQWLDVRMDHANYTRTGTLSHTYFLIEDTAQWEKKHRWDHSYSDAVMACADEMMEAYGTALEIPGQVEEEYEELLPWSKCSSWAEPYLQQADGLALLPDVLLRTDMTQDISRREFAAVAVKYYEALTGKSARLDKSAANPFTDVADGETDIRIAAQMGFVNGTGDGTTFSPDGKLTREQAVTMLGRVVELVETGAIAKGEAGGLALETGSVQRSFSDDGSISGWAKHYVEYFVSHGVVDGTDGGAFAPGKNMTREQAIKVAVVAVEK